MDLKQAQKIAVDICYRLQPHTDRINIAGSVRRGVAEVKDIEIIALPKKAPVGQIPLFGEKVQMGVIPEFSLAVTALGKVLKGNPFTGRYMQIQLPQGINLDLFMPEPDDYFRQLCIRTGSAEYVQRYIAGGWRKKKWCGSDQGLRLMKDCMEIKNKDGSSDWKCVNPNAERPPVWADEREFFAWIGEPYLHPSQRSM